ncbi:toxin-antitoxin system HicB family antitoxin, partial [Sulfobacillus acidophilus]|nr:toxin-antitoxin system HicB family antitoxin [Sulfobacillus acidophilus]
RVHKALVIEAARSGISLNALVGQKLASSIHA